MCGKSSVAIAVQAVQATSVLISVKMPMVAGCTSASGNPFLGLQHDGSGHFSPLLPYLRPSETQSAPRG